MKHRLLIIAIGLISFLNNGIASDLEKSRMIGLNGGLSQNNFISGDLYVGMALPFEQQNVEVNLGYSFFRNKTEYQGVRDLKFNSHGLFLEGNYFIIHGLYGGVRFALNFNQVDKSSQAKFDDYSIVDSPTFFTGIAGYGQIGYRQPISNKLSLKVQGQVGIHNYKIAEGYILIDNSSYDPRDAQYGIETHADFLYNLSLGLAYRF